LLYILSPLAGIAGAAAGEAVENGESAVATTHNGERVSEFHTLDNFWRRFNKAALDKAAVEKEEAELEEENVKLRSLLKQYVMPHACGTDTKINGSCFISAMIILLVVR
jgi:hypothetical protein